MSSRFRGSALSSYSRMWSGREEVHRDEADPDTSGVRAPPISVVPIVPTDVRVGPHIEIPRFGVNQETDRATDRRHASSLRNTTASRRHRAIAGDYLSAQRRSFCWMTGMP